MLRYRASGGDQLTQPAYRLRPNKAVERFLFVEAVQRMAQLKDLSEYTYYGFGGAFLEDFRILHDFFAELGFVSIEEKEETIKRQRFHLAFRNIRLRHMPFHSFLRRYTSGGEKSIFWLDYTRFSWRDIRNFMSLLQNVEPWSMVKITVRAQPRDFDSPGKLHRVFAKILPAGVDNPPKSPSAFAAVILQMLQIAIQQAVANYPDRVFQPVSSFFYNDATPMLTLTGIVCPPDDVGEILGTFDTWDYANLNWAAPTGISVPALSTKERLKLQSVLPCDDSAGILLQLTLGYMLGDGGAKDTTKQQLQQYAAFQRYFPYYVSATP